MAVDSGVVLQFQGCHVGEILKVDAPESVIGRFLSPESDWRLKADGRARIGYRRFQTAAKLVVIAKRVRQGLVHVGGRSLTPTLIHLPLPPKLRPKIEWTHRHRLAEVHRGRQHLISLPHHGR